MLIDKYLKQYQFSEHHEVEISRNRETVFNAIKNVNFYNSKFLKLLFRCRGLPSKMNSINGFIDCGFIFLEEQNNKEILLGFLLGGKFNGIKQVKPSEFINFSDQRYIKGVWNFHLSQTNKNTLLATETRVFCPCTSYRILFSIYWFFISYFSGVTRSIILNLIKQDSELK